MTTASARTTITLPPDVLADLDRAAGRAGRSRSQFIAELYSGLRPREEAAARSFLNLLTFLPPPTLPAARQANGDTRMPAGRDAADHRFA